MKKYIISLAAISMIGSAVPILAKSAQTDLTIQNQSAHPLAVINQMIKGFSQGSPEQTVLANNTGLFRYYADQKPPIPGHGHMLGEVIVKSLASECSFLLGVRYSAGDILLENPHHFIRSMTCGSSLSCTAIDGETKAPIVACQ
jgi:hypothetical protein